MLETFDLPPSSETVGDAFMRIMAGETKETDKAKDILKEMGDLALDDNNDDLNKFLDELGSSDAPQSGSSSSGGPPAMVSDDEGEEIEMDE